MSIEIVTNCYDWEVEESKMNLIIDTIMALLEPFISRLIDNKERESFMQTFVSRETISQDRKKGALSSFTGGIGKGGY